MAVSTFPRTVQDITPDWLTGALRQKGVLSGAAVSSITAEPMGVGLGFMSAMQRLSLTYDGPAPDAPTRLIATSARGYGCAV